MMAVSPVIGLAIVGLRGRAEWQPPTDSGDPSGYQQALRKYAPLVEAASQIRLEDACTEDGLERLRQVFAALKPGMPGLMPTSRDTENDDVRKPVIAAQKSASAATAAAVEALTLDGRYDEALEFAVQNYRLALMTRYFDSNTLVASNSMCMKAMASLEELLPRASERAQVLACEALAAAEETRGSPLDIMRNDMRLLFTERNLALGNGELPDRRVDRIAREAFRAASRGESVAEFVNKVAAWPQSPDRDELWSMLASWQLMLRYERMDRELPAKKLPKFAVMIVAARCKAK